MEEFFTTVDQIYKWLNYQDRRANKELEKGTGISFLNAPFLPFSSKFDECHHLNISAFPNKTTSLIYDTKLLFQYQRALAKFLEEGKIPDDSDGVAPGKPFSCSFQFLKKSFADLQIDIRHLIASVLVHIDKLTDEKPCPELMNYLNRNHYDEVQEGKIAFISFNYELLADRTVFQISRNNNKWDPRHFYMQIFSNKLVVKPPKYYMPIFLKLHGSINWAYPPEGDSLVYLGSEEKGPENPAIDEMIKNGWVPAIIPPISEKLSMLQDTPLSGKLARLWTMAFDCLLRSKRWIFIGYSLPPTDIPARWLFMSASAYKKRKNELPDIEVYNPNAIKKNADELPLLKALQPFFPVDKIKRFCCLQSVNNMKKHGK
jgi:hypothetical protein